MMTDDGVMVVRCQAICNNHDEWNLLSAYHYLDVIMGAMVSQITSLTIVHSTVHSGADQRIHQSTASLAFVRGIHRWPVNSLHKWPVTRRMFPFDDVIILEWKTNYRTRTPYCEPWYPPHKPTGARGHQCSAKKDNSKYVRFIYPDITSLLTWKRNQTMQIYPLTVDADNV